MAAIRIPEVKAPANRRKRVFAIVVWGGIVLWVWLIAGLFLYVEPAAGIPRPAAALLVLAPQSEDRMRTAEKIMAEGYAETLVMSVPRGGTPASGVCREKRPYPVICFTPEPVTTQGEARAFQRLAKQHEWQSVNVLTAKFHVARSRIILGRCYKGDLNVVTYEQNLSALSWAYWFVYETAAFIKAAANPSC